MKLKCTRKECGYEWDYNGNSNWYTTCPRCKTSVRIRAPGDSVQVKKIKEVKK